MTELFGPVYADAYDALYADKDYAVECDEIERLFSRYAQRSVRSILDLGCGTGGHSLILAQRGYQLVGVDRSPPMIAQARGKSDSLLASTRPTYYVDDIRTVRMNRRFDAVIMMFAVLGYMPEGDDVAAALQTAREHLQLGGLLLFDCWYGPAVLHQRPTERVKAVAVAGGRVTRSAVPELDPARNLCRVRFHLDRTHFASAEQTDETHSVRYFFPNDLQRFLHLAGFEPLSLTSMLHPDRPPDETSWNVLCAARAAGKAPDNRKLYVSNSPQSESGRPSLT